VPNEQNSNQRSRGLLIRVVLLIILLLVYLHTLLPGVGYSTDTAKFQFVGYVLGTPHPPGCPTYILLNHLFTKAVPFGSIAYRANLLSAVFSLLTALLLFEILKLFQIKNFTAALVCLSFGVTPSMWSQSIIAEIYSLNALFVAGVIYFFLRWNSTRKTADLLMACAIYAFSFGNHLTMATFLPAVFYLIWSTDKSVFYNRKLVPMIILLAVLGALQYLYPVWRYYDPNTVFMEMQTWDFKTFWYAITGAQFKSRMFPFDVKTVILERIPLFFRLLWKEYFLLTAIAVFGMSRIKMKKTVVFLLLAILGNIFYSLNYDIKDISVYFIPTYLILAVFLGIGIQAVSETLLRDRKYISVPLVILIPVFLFIMNGHHIDQSKNTADAEKAKSILEKVGRDAVIIAPGKEFSRHYFFYYLFAENMREKNIFLIRFWPHIIRDYVAFRKPYYFREIRKFVRAGLKVYCLKESQRVALQKRFGLKLQRVDGDLYRVEAAD